MCFDILTNANFQTNERYYFCHTESRYEFVKIRTRVKVNFRRIIGIHASFMILLYIYIRRSEILTRTRKGVTNKRGDKFFGKKGGKFERKQSERREVGERKTRRKRLSTTRHSQGPGGVR